MIVTPSRGETRSCRVHRLSPLKLRTRIGILTRMTIDRRIRRAALALVMISPLPLAAQTPEPPSLTKDPDLKLLFPLAQKVQVMAELCVKELPQQSAGVPAALATWNERHARPQLDSLIDRTMKRRAAMGRSVIRMMGAQLFNGDPAAGCSNFAALINSPENDLSISDPTALRNARRKLGAADVAFVDAPGTPPRTATTFRVATAATPTPPVEPDVPAAATLPTPDSGRVAPRDSALASSATPRAAGAEPSATAATPTAGSRRGARATRGARGGASSTASAGAGTATASGSGVLPTGNSGPVAATEQPVAGAMSGGESATTPASNARTPRTSVNDGARVASLAEVTGPAGWQKALLADGTVSFTVAKNDTGYSTLVVYPDQPLGNLPIDTVLQRWLVAQLKGKLDMADEFKYGRVYRARTTRNQPAAYANITPDFYDSRDGMNVCAVAIVRANGVWTPVMMITKDDQYQYYRQKEFGRWLATAALPGDAGSRWSLAASARPGPLQGLWFGTTLTNRLNLYGGMDLIADRHYATFYRNGVVYSALPDGGQIDNMDLNRTCAEEPTNCGTYYVQGSKLITQFPTELGLVDVDTTDIESPLPANPTVVINGQNLGRVQPVRSLRLDGDYTSIDGSSSGPNGSLMLSRTIVFHPDGRYETNGAVGFSSTPGGLASDNPTVAGYIPGSENRGTYTIDGFTLTLRPGSGPVRLATIVFFDEVRPVTGLLIDDRYYKR
jgi:hypothetical protein